MRNVLKRMFGRRFGFKPAHRGRQAFGSGGGLVRPPALAHEEAPGDIVHGYSKARLWRSWGVAAAAVLLLGATMVPWAGSSLASRPIASALAMLGLRSPGERAAGQLVDTKPGRPPHNPRVLGKSVRPPAERALGKIFPAEDLASASGPAPFSPPYIPDAPQALGAGTPQTFGIGPPGGGGPVGGGGGGGGPVGGGGGGPVGGGGGGPVGGGGGGGGGGPVGGGGGGGTVGGGGGGGGPVGEGGGGFGGGGGPPVAAVPEPATWLMMIIAFGLCGSMLRRQRRLQARRPACASPA